MRHEAAERVAAYGLLLAQRYDPRNMGETQGLCGTIMFIKRAGKLECIIFYTYDLAKAEQNYLTVTESVKSFVNMAAVVIKLKHITMLN